MADEIMQEEKLSMLKNKMALIKKFVTARRYVNQIVPERLFTGSLKCLCCLVTYYVRYYVTQFNIQVYVLVQKQ